MCDASVSCCVLSPETLMMFDRRPIVVAGYSLVVWLFSFNAFAQTAAPSGDAATGGGQHDHTQMSMPMNDGWQLMQDGILFAQFNHQGGPRGGNELLVPNWWMGMASRRTAHGQLTFTGMLSLDPATVGKAGYR